MWQRKTELPKKWLPSLADEVAVCNDVLAKEGEVYRDVPARQTVRTQIAGEEVFIKKHFGVGWKEIIKNMLSGRRPVLDASREWQALKRLQHLGMKVPAPLGFAVWGCNPAKRRSFIILEALKGMVSLETIAEGQWPELKSVKVRRRLLRKLAEMIRILHQNGINHRDLYLCHFLLPEGDMNRLDELHLIDWHRAEIRRRVPSRWLVKDLASLAFSTWPLALSNNDKRFFIRCYRQAPLKHVLPYERKFWSKIDRRAEKLYHEYRRKYLDKDA